MSSRPTYAERALRGSVIYRNLSLGSQSDDGETRTTRLLSVHTTCRLQRRPLHDQFRVQFGRDGERFAGSRGAAVAVLEQGDQRRGVAVGSQPFHERQDRALLGTELLGVGH